MAEYTKNRNIDGWPICKDDEPLSKDSILGLLNGYEIANNLLAQERDSLQAQLEAEQHNAIAAEDDNHKLSAHLELVIGAAVTAMVTLRKVATDHGFQTTDEGGKEVDYAIEVIGKAVNIARRHQQATEAPNGQ